MNKEANMDGMLHRTNARCCAPDHGCMRPGCKDRIHSQAIYGGIMVICQECKEDAALWEPVGTYVVDDPGGDIQVITGRKAVTG